MPVPFSSALYYPNIDIRNERWLRSAVLFWDSIRTIVPDPVRDPYSGYLARQLNDEGILEPIRVASDMDEIEDLSDAVLDVLTDPSVAAVMAARTDDRSASELNDLVSIHPMKLPMVIRSHLDRALNDDGWLELRPAFANFYMTLLANQLASRLGLGLITEESAADRLALTAQKGNLTRASQHRPGRHYEATGARRRLPREAAPGLLIDYVVRHIELPPDIPLRTLLKFRSDHKEELGSFRRQVNQLTNDFSDEMSIEALRQAICDQYEAEVAPALRSLRQSLQAQKWDAGFNGFLKASFFTAAPTSVALLAGLPTSVAIMAGAGVSLTATMASLANQRHQAKAASPYAYLLSLEGRW